MLDYPRFIDHIQATPFQAFAQAFEQAANYRLEQRNFGEQDQWNKALQALPAVDLAQALLDQDTVTLSAKQPLSTDQMDTLIRGLKELHPWRKGPFSFFEQVINTEWRSDWKWQRIAPHISDLKDRTVLDVGCGSGYHCWRMRGAGAKLVVGIEPMLKYLYQFQCMKHYLADEPVFVLPLTCEDMPATRLFDTVFSMGVLYHRKSPFEHLEELKQSLRPGGELILETLVVEGDVNTVLVPGKRYAAMPNVWFLPSVLMLEHWLKRLGFKNVRTVDINQTSIDEQHSTDWMTFHSLEDFLDPDDHNKTREGYPAPRRATLIAESP